MLTLPIKKKWFEMILSGEKQEEYREIKPYWTERFKNIIGGYDFSELRYTRETINFPVMLRNGYSSGSRTLVVDVTLSIGCGRPEWGADPNKEYYILRIKDFVRNL